MQKPIYPSLPDIVPTHWGASGQVNGWGPKSTVLILAAQVYHIRVDGIPRDGLRVIRVAHQHKPCTQAVRKPRAVKGRDIGAETCL